MSSKVIIPIVIAISVIVTAGIMYGISFEQQPQIVQSPPEIIYVDKTVSEFFEGTNEIKKISSQEELKNILEASSLFSANFYDTNILTRNIAV
ncbi:MAG: copper amine oxidase, partial [Moritella sp.]